MKSWNWKAVYRYRYMYILALPGFLYFLIFKIAPLWGLSLAFVDYNAYKGLLGSDFVGFNNFMKFFKSNNFYLMLRNTLVISLMNLILFFPAPIMLALLLNEVKGDRFRKVTQTIVYLPHFLSWVVIAGLTFFIFSSDIGLINKLILANGGDAVGFLSNPKLFWWFLLGQTTWKEVGWQSIIYLAAITQIDMSLYEAANVDGASRFQKLRYITLPGLMPTVVTMFIIRLGTVFDVSLDQILMMKNAFVADVAEVFDTYAYTQGIMQGNLSTGVTVGIFKGVVCMILVVGTNKFIKHLGYEGIY
jgi:putative aldouronate transport system permease protein